MTAVQAALVAVWPLFGLRIRSERLVLRLPTDRDLVDLMAVVQHHWGLRAQWAPESWHLNFMIELDGRPIGAQSLHATEFATMRTVATGSWRRTVSPGRSATRTTAAGHWLQRGFRARRSGPG